MSKRYYVASSWKNVEIVREIWKAIDENGHLFHDWTSYGYLSGEVDYFGEDFIHHNKVKSTFNGDLGGIKVCDVFILVSPAGNSSHIETGVAYMLAKRMVLVGEVARDCFYNVFDEFYVDSSHFINDEFGE